MMDKRFQLRWDEEELARAFKGPVASLVEI